MGKPTQKMTEANGRGCLPEIDIANAIREKLKISFVSQSDLNLGSGQA